MDFRARQFAAQFAFALVIGIAQPAVAAAQELQDATSEPVAENVVVQLEEAPLADEVVATDESLMEEQASEEAEEAELDPEGESMMMGDGEEEASTPTSTIRTVLPQADDASGALVYEYPISIPPGRNGVQPDLKLTYSSQANGVLGWLGHGWDISIPSIERTTKKGSEKFYTDSTFISSLTGELAMSASGTYVSRYEAGDFVAYAFNGTSWTAKDKKGTTYLFGPTAGSRMDASGTNSWIVRWLLAEVRDTNDNYVKYEYYKDAGQIYPSKITYTGHGSTDGPFEIEFVLEGRPDQPVQYRGGFSVSTNHRLDEILVKVNGTWTRKYGLGYAAGDGGYRTLLETITETGRDELTSITTTLPAQDHDYQTSTAGWSLDSNYTIPKETWCWDSDESNNPVMEFADQYGIQKGVRIADVNGDGLADILLSRHHAGDGSGCDLDTAVHLNKGDGTGWVKSAWTVPVPFINSTSGKDYWGAQLVEVNGDGLTDIIYSGWWGSNVNGVYINNGSGWTLDTNYQWPEDIAWNTEYTGTPVQFTDWNNKDFGLRVADVNGDGLVDLLKYVKASYGNAVMTWVNKGDGTGWARNTRWLSPVPFSEATNSYRDTWGAQFADLNNDGLVDIFWSNALNGSPHEAKFYLNTGHAWERSYDYSMPDGIYSGHDLYFADSDGKHRGVKVADLNADGFPDLVQSFDWAGQTWDHFGTFISKADGTGWNRDLTYIAPVAFLEASNSTDRLGTQLVDLDGDALPEIIWSGTWLGSRSYGVYTKSGLVADDLSRVTYPTGGTTDITYKGTAEYRSGSGPANAALPFSLQVVQKTENDDGFGTLSTTWRTYEGAKMWIGGPFDRRFAGFARILESDTASNTRITSFHQGDASATSTGEYWDHESKIGRAYRTEVVDSSSNTMSISLDRWERVDNATSTASFVHRTQKLEMTYDGDGDHKDRAESYAYDASNGNLIERLFWGEVNGSSDGTFTDTGSDKRALSIAYATNTTDYVIGLPSRETLVGQSGATVRETKYYYDNESFGDIDEGNLTKEERWVEGSSYVDVEKTYDAYGLVTQEKDPRDKTTTYAYDEKKLYPTTVTNPLGHLFQQSRDYSSGLVRSATDANLLATVTVFDGLDRPLEEKQPDQSSSSTSVTRTQYAYADTGLAANVRRTDWLDGTNGVDTWTYLDGFGRPIQIRKETETSYAATDIAYDSRELLLKESLPYVSSGASRTSPTGTSSLYTTYTYDALERPLTVIDAVGTTSYAYDDWKTTITDPRGKVKRLFRDAHDRLVEVEEVNGGSTYSTQYGYDGNDNLTGITDALGNIRAFTYDGLGRRRVATDLHAPADGTYGTWVYAYDAAGNLTDVTDPKGQEIAYAYDDLNRPLSEDLAGNPGIETVFSYDACTYGKGKLCLAATDGATTTLAYGPTGLVASETKELDGLAYQTDTTYDRQGIVLTLMFPDGSAQQNAYGAGGLLETVERKEQGDGSWTAVVTDVDWSPTGQLTTIAYANGVETVNAYDAAEKYRLESKVTTLPDETAVQDLAYAYDANGNITQIVDASDTHSAKTLVFSYDDLNRLTGATSTDAIFAGDFVQSYVYDPIGNLTYRSDVGSYAYDGTGYANPHAATSVGGTGYGYDENGNLTSRGSDVFAWDYRNRLATAVVDGATSTFAYDHQGVRTSMTNDTGTTRYASKSYSVTGGVPMKHIFAGDLLVATVEGSTSTAVVRYVHTDHLTGSSVISSATGTQVELLDYYPYGGIRLDEKATDYSEVRKFAGHEFDDATGLSYMGARYYDAGIGRFLAQDPVFLVVGDPQRVKEAAKLDLQQLLADPQAFNSYAYARNNPLRYVDPDGRWFLEFSVGAKFSHLGLGVGVRVNQSGLNGIFSVGAGWGETVGIEFHPQGNLNDRLTDTVTRTAKGALPIFGFFGVGAGVTIEGDFESHDPLGIEGGNNQSAEWFAVLGQGASISQDRTWSLPLVRWQSEPKASPHETLSPRSEWQRRQSIPSETKTASPVFEAGPMSQPDHKSRR